MSSAFAPQYVNGVYIPAGLLIVGIAIVKREWLPYAVALAAVLGAWKVYSNGGILLLFPTTTQLWLTTSRLPQGAQAQRLPGVRAQGEDGPVP